MTVINHAVGHHLIAEFNGAENLTDHQKAENAFREAVAAAGATLLFVHMHSFKTDAMNEAGFTGVAVLAESHISIHTWPEHRYAAIDIFMCGDAKPELALTILQEHFNPESVTQKSLTRQPHLPFSEKAMAQ